MLLACTKQHSCSPTAQPLNSFTSSGRLVVLGDWEFRRALVNVAGAPGVLLPARALQCPSWTPSWAAPPAKQWPRRLLRSPPPSQMAAGLWQPLRATCPPKVHPKLLPWTLGSRCWICSLPTRRWSPSAAAPSALEASAASSTDVEGIELHSILPLTSAAQVAGQPQAALDAPVNDSAAKLVPSSQGDAPKAVLPGSRFATWGNALRSIFRC